MSWQRKLHIRAQRRVFQLFYLAVAFPAIARDAFVFHCSSSVSAGQLPSAAASVLLWTVRKPRHLCHRIGAGPMHAKIWLRLPRPRGSNKQGTNTIRQSHVIFFALTLMMMQAFKSLDVYQITCCTSERRRHLRSSGLLVLFDSYIVMSKITQAFNPIADVEHQIEQSSHRSIGEVSETKLAILRHYILPYITLAREWRNPRSDFA